MKASDIMQHNVKTCGPETDLNTVARLMWDFDCGVIPVADAEGQPVGMITDRDITMGCAFTNKPLTDIQAREVANGRPVYCCSMEDDLPQVLAAMQRYRVRRMPVVDGARQLVGIISLDDLAAAAGKTAKRSGITFEDIASTMKLLSHTQTKTEAA